MEIYLLRHGNTFENFQEPVWLGSKQDLDLTDYGIKQAYDTANFFKDIDIDKIISSPLKRTRKFAEIISEKKNIPYYLDDRLLEIDFGDWGGLSSTQIIEKYGKEVLDSWSDKNIFPVNFNWAPSPEKIKHEIAELISSLKGDKLILISSQVRIRYFLSLIPGELEKRINAGKFKVSPGSISKISKIDNNWVLDFWNVKPDEIS